MPGFDSLTLRSSNYQLETLPLSATDAMNVFKGIVVATEMVWTLDGQLLLLSTCNTFIFGFYASSSNEGR